MKLKREDMRIVTSDNSFWLQRKVSHFIFWKKWVDNGGLMKNLELRPGCNVFHSKSEAEVKLKQVLETVNNPKPLFQVVDDNFDKVN